MKTVDQRQLWEIKDKREVTLSVADVHAAYLRKEILRGLTLHVKEGEVVALLGANGSGKSTLLRAIAGLLPVSAGSIYFEHRDLNRLSARSINRLGVGYLMQDGAVFPNLTISENLELALGRGRGQSGSEKFCQILALFPELQRIQGRRAGLLSGGERRVLSVAMVLIQEPKLLLLDEPSAGLSPELATTILRKVEEMVRANGTSVLLVEQDLPSALRLAERTYLLRNGTAQELGPTESTDVESILKYLLFQ